MHFAALHVFQPWLAAANGWSFWFSVCVHGGGLQACLRSVTVNRHTVGALQHQVNISCKHHCLHAVQQPPEHTIT